MCGNKTEDCGQPNIFQFAVKLCSVNDILLSNLLAIEMPVNHAQGPIFTVLNCKEKYEYTATNQHILCSVVFIRQYVQAYSFNPDQCKKTYQFETRGEGDKSNIQNSTDHSCEDTGQNVLAAVKDLDNVTPF